METFVTIIFATSMTLSLAIAVLAIAGIRWGDRDAIPLAAGAVGFFATAFAVSHYLNDVLLWFTPGSTSGASIISRAIALGVAAISATRFAEMAEWVTGATVSSSAPLPSSKAPEPPQSIDHSQPVQMITTAFESSALVRTPWDARANTRATDAQIVALADAERLALAAAKAADAEAKGIEAMLRRADRLTQLQMRRVFEEQAQQEQLTTMVHRVGIAGLKREKERHEVKRDTMQAQHSLEATKEFKAVRFAIGLARARARQTDAEVDGKTAEAAVVKIAGELAKLTRRQSPDVVDWLDKHLTAIQTAIEEDESDGRDTTEQRLELALLQRLKTARDGAE